MKAVGKNLTSQQQAGLYYARRNRQGRVVLQGLTQWESSLAILTGDYVQNAGSAYVADHSGTTGATAPTGYMKSYDGGVEWTYVPPQMLNDLVFEKPGSP